MNRTLAYLSLILLVPPFIVEAQTIEQIIGNSERVVSDIISLLFFLATVVFFWGIVKYIFAGGDEDKLKEARTTILYGIVFLGIMVAVWGFVLIIVRFVFGGAGTTQTIPGPDIVQPL